MTKFEGCYLTNAGRSMVYDTGLKKITFTKAVTGSGIYASEQDIAGMTELKVQKQEFGLESFSESEECKVCIKFKINNAGLTENYNLSEIGLYAQGDDGKEQLYCVAYAMDGHTEEIPANDDSIMYFTAVSIETVVSCDANVTIVYSEEHEWTKEYVDGVKREISLKIEQYLPKDGDSQNLTISFDSGDSENANKWTDVAVMESGEEHRSLIEKISIMFKNVRYLYKLLGTTDISKIGDGTVTGAIMQALNYGNIMTTKEQINANTDIKNVAGAMAMKEMFGEINSNLANIFAAKWGGVEPNTDIVTQSSIQWNTWGEICFVYVYAYIKLDAKYTDYVLATGLPYAKFGYAPMGTAIDQDTNKHFTIRVKDRTELVIESNVNAPFEGHIRGFMGYCFNQM